MGCVATLHVESNVTRYRAVAGADGSGSFIASGTSGLGVATGGVVVSLGAAGAGAEQPVAANSEAKTRPSTVLRISAGSTEQGEQRLRRGYRSDTAKPRTQ